MPDATWFQWVPIALFVAGVYVQNRRHAQSESACIKRDLNAFKLEVAKEYVSVSHLKEVEDRIMKSLGRIETRLDSLRTGHD
jgi:hypothetical protein